MAYNLIVVYQLTGTASHYEAVEAAIKDLGAWAHLQLTTWYVKSAKPADQARDYIWQSMQVGDVLLVADIQSAAWQGLIKEVGDFLIEHWQK